MAEYYLSHLPRLILAEVPGEGLPEELEGPLEAEEWVNGWLLTAPANPAHAREIMGGLAKVSGNLPPETLLLYPYDEASMAGVMVNWIKGLQGNIELASFLGEEVEDNVEAYENLLLGEATLWRGFREILGPAPEGKSALQTIEGYEATVQRALEDLRDVIRRGPENVAPEVLHRLSNEAKRVLIKDKRQALIKLVADQGKG